MSLAAFRREVEDQPVEVGLQDTASDTEYQQDSVIPPVDEVEVAIEESQQGVHTTSVIESNAHVPQTTDQRMTRLEENVFKVRQHFGDSDQACNGTWCCRLGS